MDKLLLVYNPVAGGGLFKDSLDEVVEILQTKGYQVIVHRTGNDENLDLVISSSKEFINAVVAAGGDGTIHSVVNAMLKNNMAHIPLGIIPVGTSNDIANYLRIPSSFSDAIEIIGTRKVTYIDIGEVNDSYFMNVASGGLLMEVPHTTNVKLKNITGRLAYYLKGIEKLPSLKPIPVKISCPEETIDEEILLFVVLNSSTAGGFKNLAPAASMIDGKLDVLIFKAVPIARLLSVFVKILKGDHLEDTSLKYFQTTGPIEITCEASVSTDVDGEKGPDFPMYINLHKRVLPVFVA